MQIDYLGPLQVLVGGTGADTSGDASPPMRAVEVPGRRLRCLLCRLAIDAGTAVSASELVEAVWGGDGPGDPLGALQALVSRLRRVLGGADAVEQSPAGYRLAVAPDDVDATLLTRAVADGEGLLATDPDRAAARFGEALALLRGEVLADSDDAAATTERSRVAALADRARNGLAQALLTLGRPAQALEVVVPGAEADPLREDLARWRMAALAALDRSSEALLVFERTRAALADELGADPSAALAGEHLRLLQGKSGPPARQATQITSAAGARGAPSNLPARASSFVGREAETQRLSALLAGHRLVTVLGPGGAGKTSLAVETARATATGPGAPAGGTWLVELAPVSPHAAPGSEGSPHAGGEIDAALIDVLGARETRLDRRRDLPGPASSRALLLEHLADAEALVVLDNCEHVVAAAADLAADLLARCPGVRLLATSREPLAVDGEHLLPLAPLEVPEPGAPAHEVLRSPAVQLLIGRAAAAGSAWGPTGSAWGPTGSAWGPTGSAWDSIEGELPASVLESVAEITRRLDGLPLALELAAARLRVLSPADVAGRLDDRFRLLTGGRRTAVPRHRTLRAVVEWSWDLLDDAERDLVECCAVFAGGTTPEGAAAVLGIETDTDDQLQALADRSLLVPLPTPLGTRYRMLETLREYGLERLAARGVLRQVRDRHAAWYSQLVARADAALRGPGQGHWTAVLDAERDDVVAALGHLVASGCGAQAVDLAVHLGWYGSMREDPETFRWCEVALATPGALESPLASVAHAVAQLHRVARQGFATGPADEAQVQSALALDAVRGLHPAVAPLQLLLFGFAGRADLLEEAAERGLTDPDPWTRAAVRQVRTAFAENAGDLATVRRDVELGLADWEALGDSWGAAGTLVTRSQLRAMDGDTAGAIDDLERARTQLASLPGTGDAWQVQLRLADLRSRAGDLDGAHRELDAVREGAGANSVFALLADATAVWVDDAAGEARREAALDVLEHRLTQHGLAQHDTARGPATSTGEQALPSELAHAHGLAMARAAAAAAAARSPRQQVRERAAGHLRAAHATAVDTQDGPILAMVAEAGVEVSLRQGRAELAARLVGVGRVLRGAADLGAPREHQVGELLRRELGDCFTVLVAETAGGSREQAMDLLAEAVETLSAPS